MVNPVRSCIAGLPLQNYDRRSRVKTPTTNQTPPADSCLMVREWDSRELLEVKETHRRGETARHAAVPQTAPAPRRRETATRSVTEVQASSIACRIATTQRTSVGTVAWEAPTGPCAGREEQRRAVATPVRPAVSAQRRRSRSGI
jgi:hypothetical protein